MTIKNKNQFKTEIDESGRVCTACGIYKKWIDFKGHKRSLTGYSSKCKGCYKEKRKTAGRKKERYSSKNRNQWLKNNTPIVWKSNLIRNRLLSKSTPETRQDVPTRTILRDWLSSNKKFYCFYSGDELSIYDITIDHKVPLGRGGSNKLENLCIASNHMNTAKGQMTDIEFFSLLNLISSWEDAGENLLKRLKQGFFTPR